MTDYEPTYEELQQQLTKTLRLLKRTDKAWRKTARELKVQRDFIVEEYERAVGCGKQGYLHCAMHLFNAITNARIGANPQANNFEEERW